MLRFFTVSRLARNPNPFFETGSKQKGRASKRLCRCFPLQGQLLEDNSVQVSGVSYLLPVAEALPLSDFAAGVFVEAGIAAVDVIAKNRKGQ